MWEVTFDVQFIVSFFFVFLFFNPLYKNWFGNCIGHMTALKLSMSVYECVCVCLRWNEKIRDKNFKLKFNHFLKFVYKKTNNVFHSEK